MALLSPSTRGGKRKKFGHDEDLAIISMTQDEKTAKEIAEKIGRSEPSVRYRQKWLRDTDMEKPAELKKFHKERGTS